MTASWQYPATLEFHDDGRMARWRPFVQWLLAIPHLAVANVLSSLRGVLTVISLVTVLVTRRIPRPVFDAIVMTWRYEWRALSYAAFLHGDYPPFDFTVGAADDGVEPHTQVAIRYPERLARWAPLYKWLLALPHYLVLVLLWVGTVFAVLAAGVAVVATGRYPAGVRDYVVGVSRWTWRVQAYVGLLTDEYPPFRLRG
ncbi:MAG: DUF4389 domain-containing protein [Jatrophihabitans sp.]|uniref:DUF4389 domain-containing protein n=1 Tax=Jatrophihabitans sp. TaxID=1932789 RepID=UPI003F7D3437